VVSVGSGRVLVESGNNSTLTAATNAEGHADIAWAADTTGAPVNISSEVTSGKMAGWLQARDTKIAGYKSSLDDIAQTLTTEVNALHAAGYGLNGSHGDNLFSGAGAADMAVNPDILNDPNRIAAASAAGTVPGDASNAVAIAGLRATLTMGGTSTTPPTSTFDDAANALVSQVGYDVQAAKSYQSHQTDMLTALENYRESVSGVNLDEEMVNLVKYQAAYNAAAKMITMGDDMLTSLMNMLR
jgi:flagellar hook-associated protein 1 FlgK